MTTDTALRGGAEAVRHYLAEAFPNNAPGLAVGVAQAGKPMLLAARGLANLETAASFTPTTAFRVCSLTKQFLCALLWRRQLLGEIDFDHHPGRYATAYRGLDAALNIRHLMQNRSGIRDHWVLAMWMGAQAEQEFTLADGEEVIRRAPDSMYAPGSQYHYSNSNFVILEAVLAAISGRDFADELRAEILAPLGMHSTYLGVNTGDPLPADARGYRRHNGAWEREVTRMHWSASAGIVSTLEDLLKWEGCLVDPVKSGLGFVARIAEPMPFSSGAPGSYASGINHFAHDGRSMQSHQGALRGWRSIQLRFPAEKTSIYVLMNRTENPRPVAFAVARRFGCQPIWQRQLPRAQANRGRVIGSFVCAEQGLLVRLAKDEDAAGLSLYLHGDASPLFETGSPRSLTTEDGRCTVSFVDAGQIHVAWRDTNVSAIFRRCDETDAARFRADGAFHCAPLASTLTILVEDGARAVVFDGIFGRSTHFPLHPLDARTAWFDIARAVDESPPGRVLLQLDAAGAALELSCPVARRVVFRRP